MTRIRRGRPPCLPWFESQFLRRTGTVLVLAITFAGCTEPRRAGTPDPTATTPPTGPSLLVLGTAQDGGFPHASCHCERCSLARKEPAVARAVASVAIVLPDADEAFLIDATPDLRAQLDRVRSALGRSEEAIDRAPVAGVFLTHAHMGHYLGLGFLGFEAVHTREVPVWGTERMLEFLGENAPWDQLLRLQNLVARPLVPGEAVELGSGVTLRAVAVPHRGEYTDTVGYLVAGSRQRVLYLPDIDPWERWSTPIEQFLETERVDVALLDGCFYSSGELPGRDLSKIGHPFVVDSMDRLAATVASGRTRVFFTHLNHSNPLLDARRPERGEVERRGFAVLADGERFEL